jgi:hypothetical protein
MQSDQSILQAQLIRLERAAQSGARWFYWIAALSLITSIVSLSGSNWRFIVSLGATQLVDDLAKQADLGGAAMVIAIVFDLLATGLFALLGYLAQKHYSWSFIIGAVLFGLDSLIFLLAQDWIGIIFHAYVLYRLVAGFNASRNFGALVRELQSMPPPLPSPSIFAGNPG